MRLTMMVDVVFFCACFGVAFTVDAFANDNAMEFGRTATRGRLGLKRRVDMESTRPKASNMIGVGRRNKRSKSSMNRSSMDEFVFTELDQELLFDQMSMSMSFGGYPSKPSVGGPSMPSVSSPSTPSVGNPSTPSSATNNPAYTPSSPSANTPSRSPSSGGGVPTLPPSSSLGTLLPTFSGAPTVTGSPTSSLSPASAPTTESSQITGIAPTTVFDLDEETGAVAIAEPPFAATTVVRMEISYIVEAFVNETEAFEADIDWLIFVSSLVASLGATSSGELDLFVPPRRLESIQAASYHKERHLLSSSSFQRSCNATIDGANCYIMGADIVYILNGDRNADYSAYLAYLALNNDMKFYDAGLPDVARVVYLSPLPILPPVAVEDQADSGDAILSTRNDDSNTPLIAGGTLAMSAAGSMALFLWMRNRRTRNRQHLRLLEDVSVTSPNSSPRESAQREIVSHPV